MTYAIVNEKNEVVNVIEADSIDCIPLVIERQKLFPIETGSLIGVGWAYGDSGFFDPNAVVPEPELTEDQVGNETTPDAPEVIPPQTEPETIPAEVEPEVTPAQNDPANS